VRKKDFEEAVDLARQTVKEATSTKRTLLFCRALLHSEELNRQLREQIFVHQGKDFRVSRARLEDVLLRLDALMKEN